MASRDNEGSHLSGVLGCLGLGSSSPGPEVMKWVKEVTEDDLTLPMESRKCLFPPGRDSCHSCRILQTPTIHLLPPELPRSCLWNFPSVFLFQDPREPSQPLIQLYWGLSEKWSLGWGSKDFEETSPMFAQPSLEKPIPLKAIFCGTSSVWEISCGLFLLPILPPGNIRSFCFTSLPQFSCISDIWCHMFITFPPVHMNAKGMHCVK